MLFALLACVALPARAKVEEGFILRSGKLEGILTSKSVAWVEVKADDSYAKRYLAPWRGGSPARGGGFDADTLDMFNETAVGNRVRLEWFWDGHLRVKSLKTLRPMMSSGTAAGLVVEVGDKWMDVLRPNGERERYYARWVGGLVADGGGYHGPTLDYLQTLEIETQVEFTWTYDARPRILRVREMNETEPKEEKRLSFEGFEPIRRSPSPSAAKPAVNPFDLVPAGPIPLPPTAPVNPFDLAPNSPAVPPENPNPFDQAPPPPSEPPPGNPFDLAPPVPTPANPFDAVPAPNDS